MKIHDLNGIKQNNKTYGGTAGVKIGITVGDTDYLVKYPGKLKELGMKNIELSYSNGPACEYIGCKIFQSIGIPVQDTWLGVRNEKTVVICKDFLNKGDILIPFKDVKATFEPAFTDPQGDITNGTGTNLEEILRTIEEHPLAKQMYPELENRFWDMFVVDALIGNPDRNNENWGIIRDIDDQYRLPPVFDCGNCLNSKLSDRQLEEYLQNPQKMKDAAIQRPCIFERAVGKRINAYSYIEKAQNQACNEAVKRIVPNINMSEISAILADIPSEIVSPTQKKFYEGLMSMRYEQVLQPTYEKILAREKEIVEREL